jgi:hypothetical protein
MIDISIRELKVYKVFQIDKNTYVLDLQDKQGNFIVFFFESLNEIAEFAEGIKGKVDLQQRLEKEYKEKEGEDYV